MDWQPIESAPKDGSPILLYSAWSEEILTGRWSWAWQLPETAGFKHRSLDTTEGYWVEKPYIEYDKERYPFRPIHEATHWMPLPPPPTEDTK